MALDVTLYTQPACAQCALTKTALAERRIAFTERSAADHAEELTATGLTSTPVIAFTVEFELVVWQGHRPDQIDLLAELIAHGPLPRYGFRDITEAGQAVLSRMQAMRHIRGHELESEDFFADHGSHPLYCGDVLLNWLGY